MFDVHYRLQYCLTVQYRQIKLIQFFGQKISWFLEDGRKYYHLELLQDHQKALTIAIFLLQIGHDFNKKVWDELSIEKLFELGSYLSGLVGKHPLKIRRDLFEDLSRDISWLIVLSADHNLLVAISFEIAESLEETLIHLILDSTNRSLNVSLLIVLKWVQIDILTHQLYLSQLWLHPARHVKEANINISKVTQLT